MARLKTSEQESTAPGQEIIQQITSSKRQMLLFLLFGFSKKKKFELKMLIIKFELGFPFTPLPSLYAKLF